jgi:hypothetical protein
MTEGRGMIVTEALERNEEYQPVYREQGGRESREPCSRPFSRVEGVSR